MSGVGRADDEPKRAGRFIIVNLSPLPKNRHVLKYNSVVEAAVEDPDDQDDEEEIDEHDEHDEEDGEEIDEHDDKVESEELGEEDDSETETSATSKGNSDSKD